MKIPFKQRFNLILKTAIKNEVKKWLNSFLSGKTRKKLRLWWFIFKWILIGKYHCNLPKWTCKFWDLIHKLLWFFIAFSIIVTLNVLAKAFF